jgi:hypothetical protein
MAAKLLRGKGGTEVSYNTISNSPSCCGFGTPRQVEDALQQSSATDLQAVAHLLKSAAKACCCH